MVRSRQLAAVAAGLALAGGVGAWALADGDNRPALGLFTTLPIYWSESGSVGETIDGKAPPHWARMALEHDYRLEPLDALDSAKLAMIDRLMLAQPRPLSPGENVALDDWVRGGGRLLLFADPMLTSGSRFPVGDRRRPQDVVVLSPILKHWGLELQFDEDNEAGEGSRAALGTRIDVEMPGRLVAFGPTTCVFEADGLVATCPIAKGRAVIVADAAMLDADREGGEAPLEALTKAAFDH